jgi:energy-converting hydrogenase Eha subunit C
MIAEVAGRVCITHCECVALRAYGNAAGARFAAGPAVHLRAHIAVSSGELLAEGPKRGIMLHTCGNVAPIVLFGWHDVILALSACRIVCTAWLLVGVYLCHAVRIWSCMF